MSQNWYIPRQGSKFSKPTRTFRQSFPILKFLSVNPDKTAYAVEKQLKIERHTVLDSLELLEKAGLVKITDRKKLETGLERKEYRVTPQGVVALLQGHPEYIQLSKEYVRDLAEVQKPFLPLIFGKWDTFRKNKMEDTARKYLLVCVQRDKKETDRLAEVASGRELSPSLYATEIMHRHFIYQGMLIQSTWFGSDESDRWATMIRNDKEFREMAEKEILCLREEAQRELRKWDGALDELHGKRPQYTGLVLDTDGEQDYEGLAERVDEIWKYARAKALDENKPLPSLEDTIADKMPRRERASWERWKRKHRKKRV
jgi:DNA-binding PadR family transcriptional regulator